MLPRLLVTSSVVICNLQGAFALVTQKVDDALNRRVLVRLCPSQLRERLGDPALTTGTMSVHARGITNDYG